jgi:phosphoribosylformylglycinamidine synthase
MEGSILGVHSAHGEGRFYFPDPSVLERVQKDGLIIASYVEASGEATERYPYNPNGSVLGIAGLCDLSGRHNVLMPHPERTVLPWQQTYAPPEWRKHSSAPWLRLFQNARELCD